MEPPKFSGALKTVRAPSGSEATIFVPAPTGTPPFNYEWSRAGATLDDRFTSSTETGGVRLTVSSARVGDSGVYTLQASNSYGKDTARVRLEVSGEEGTTGDDPPTFLRRLQDLTVKVGTRTRFLVEIVSSTECKVTWYRNERRPMEAERVALVRDGNFWCADVAAVSVDDAGRWTCTAENEGGRASCSAHLNVLVPKAYKRPEFVEELRALLTEKGTVSLECKVVGVPTPVLRWFKDSREIKAGDVFALTANAEDPTSLGTYTCEAVNCMGRAYSSSKVHVVGRSREGSALPTSSTVSPEPPPIFTKELDDQFVKICEPLTLSCQLVVPPWPRAVVWYNKEGKVEPGERYHAIEDGVGGYLMEVPSAEWADEGEWKCVATSSGGRVGITTCYVTMDVPKNYRKPRFMENLQAVLTEEGLVSFECKVVGFPTPVLSWFKDGQELKPGDVYQLTGTNSLGSYCCIARNCMGHASSSAELTVEDIQNQLNEEEKLQLFSKNQAPKFLQGLKSVEAKIDEPFRFTIKVAIPPEPSVSWYRDDQPVDESARCRHGREEKGVFYLDIQNLEFFDQAEWKCVAMNDFGNSVTSCFLKLIIPRHYKKPRFLENLQAILTDEGAVNLECKVIGVPQPVLKWYKDGEELKPGDIHRIISGQDGTCCLGTYTCEAQNCMGIASSSASLLGFDDSMKAKKKQAEEQALQRNLSLSTIHEERTSQMYDTPVGDITLDDKGEISFSFDGKEVSVSLYETPDLTEEEALQIVEMYADQLSENVTEHNVVELPPLRFVKETSTSGNLLMEAIIIDVSPEYFASPEEDLRTEADIEDMSIADENAAPQLSLDTDLGDDYLEKTMALLSDEKSEGPKKQDRKKSDSARSGDDFFSLSRDQSISEEKRDDDTQVFSESDAQSFASARSSEKAKSKSSKPSDEEFKDTSEMIKTLPTKEETLKHPAQPEEIPAVRPKRERRTSRSSRRSSSGSEKSVTKLREETRTKEITTKKDEEVLVKSEPPQEKAIAEHVSEKPTFTEEEFKTKMSSISSILSKVINDVQLIERDIILKSELMSSAATASRSLEIISSLITPLSEIHSVADASKESIAESKEVRSTLFSSLPQPLKALQQSLTIIEKCIDVETDTKTLVKKTCVALIENCGADLLKLMAEFNSISSKLYLLTDERILTEIDLLSSEMSTIIKYSAETIKTRNLLSETNESKPEETSLETKHLKETQKAVFELRSPVNSLLCITENADTGSIVDIVKVKRSEVILNDMSASIQDLQAALEQIETLSVKESTTALNKYNTEIIENVMESILRLRSSFEQLSVESKKDEDKVILKQTLSSIKENLCEISSHVNKIERNIGKFDILQSENKLEALQKMAQILIALENNLPRLETIPEVKIHMDVFHKNLTKVLENVIESNEARKYFTLMEICDAVNRLNASIKNIDSDIILSLASLSNTLQIVQEHFVKNVFESELNCNILSNITDVLVSVQEAINNAEESSVHIDSEHVQEISPTMFDETKAHIVVESIEQTIAAISNVKSLESTNELKISLLPTLENITPVLEELKHAIASFRTNEITKEEHLSEMSDISSATQILAIPIRQLNENITILSQVVVENLSTIKEDNEIMAILAEPLHELHTTLEVLQQDVISQCGVDVKSYNVSENMANAVQSLQSCIVMIQEHAEVEGADDMSTLEDISGIKTTADAIRSDRLVLPEAEVTAVQQSLQPMDQETVTTAPAKALQTLNEHITVLQTPEIIDALDTLSEVSDYSSLKSVVLGLGDLHSGIEEILHPVLMESSNEVSNFVNTSKITAIAEPMQELQQSLSVLDMSNIPIYEHILEMSAGRIHSVIQTISDFKDQLTRCIQVVFPAMETADKTIEISNKVESLREVCEHLKEIIQSTKSESQVPIKEEVIVLEDTVNQLLDATDVTKGIKIDKVKSITEELYQNIVTAQEEIIQFTPLTPKCTEEAKIIQAIDEIESNIAILEQYEFVDLSKASDITSCTSPQLAMELESESLMQMEDIVENAVNVVQDSTQETPVADLMIIEDFFKTCKNEFAILRCLMSKQLSHKKMIRLLQEFVSLQSTVNEFRIRRSDLQLSHDIDGYLTTFLIHADDCLKTLQKSLIQLISSQSEILFNEPSKKLEKFKKVVKTTGPSTESAVIKAILKKFDEVITIAKPCIENAKFSIIEELKSTFMVPSNANELELVNKMDDIIFYIENQTFLATLDEVSKNTLGKVLSCLQKHSDYKDAVGSGKTLIIIKSLAECTDILQGIIPEIKTKQFVEQKEDENVLKLVLKEMLEPLQSLHNQLVTVQEQILSGVEEDSISIDITSTESLVQTMTEIHKEIVDKIKLEETIVSNEEIALIMDVDKEIHSIQDNIRSIDNEKVAQVIKDISKPLEDIEKSLHTMLSSDKIIESKEKLPPEKAKELIMHIDQYIELIEIVEEISAVIKIEDLKETVDIAKELRENIAAQEILTESQVADSDWQEINRKQTELAYKLQTSISTLQVQVLESVQELASAFGTNILQKIANVTAQLQADLVAVTGVQVAVQAPVDYLAEMTKTISDLAAPIQATQLISLEKSEITEASQLIALEELNEVEDKSIVPQATISTEVDEKLAAESVEVAAEETVTQLAKDEISETVEKILCEELVPLEIVTPTAVDETEKLMEQITSSIVNVPVTSDEMDSAVTSDTTALTSPIISEDIKSAKVTVEEQELKQVVDTLLHHIEQFLSEDVLDTINELCHKKIEFNLAQTINDMHELRTMIAANEIVSAKVEISGEYCHEYQHAALAQKLNLALSTMQTIVFETTSNTSTELNKEKLEIAINTINQLQGDLTALISTELPQVEIKIEDKIPDKPSKVIKDVSTETDEITVPETSGSKEDEEKDDLTKKVLVDEIECLDVNKIGEDSMTSPDENLTQSVEMEVDEVKEIKQTSLEAILDTDQFIQVEGEHKDITPEESIRENKEVLEKHSPVSLEKTKKVEENKALKSDGTSEIAQSLAVASEEDVVPTVTVDEENKLLENLQVKDNTLTILKRASTHGVADSENINIIETLLHHIEQYTSEQTVEAVRALCITAGTPQLIQSLTTAEQLRESIVSSSTTSFSGDETKLLPISQMQIVLQLHEVLTQLNAVVIHSPSLAGVEENVVTETAVIIKHIQDNLAALIANQIPSTEEDKPVALQTEIGMNPEEIITQDREGINNTTEHETLDRIYQNLQNKGNDGDSHFNNIMSEPFCEDILASKINQANLKEEELKKVHLDDVDDAKPIVSSDEIKLHEVITVSNKNEKESALADSLKLSEDIKADIVKNESRKASPTEATSSSELISCNQDDLMQKPFKEIMTDTEISEQVTMDKREEFVEGDISSDTQASFIQYEKGMAAVPFLNEAETEKISPQTDIGDSKDSTAVCEHHLLDNKPLETTVDFIQQDILEEFIAIEEHNLNNQRVEMINESDLSKSNENMILEEEKNTALLNVLDNGTTFNEVIMCDETAVEMNAESLTIEHRANEGEKDINNLSNVICNEIILSENTESLPDLDSSENAAEITVESLQDTEVVESGQELEVLHHTFAKSYEVETQKEFLNENKQDLIELPVDVEGVNVSVTKNDNETSEPGSDECKEIKDFFTSGKEKSACEITKTPTEQQLEGDEPTIFESLLQHIEQYVDESFYEKVDELGIPANYFEFTQSIVVALDLKDSINNEIKVGTVEDSTIAQNAALAKELNNMLSSILKTISLKLDVPVDTLKDDENCGTLNIIIRLQEDLKKIIALKEFHLASICVKDEELQNISNEVTDVENDKQLPSAVEAFVYPNENVLMREEITAIESLKTTQNELNDLQTAEESIETEINSVSVVKQTIELQQIAEQHLASETLTEQTTSLKTAEEVLSNVSVAPTEAVFTEGKSGIQEILAEPNRLNQIAIIHDVTSLENLSEFNNSELVNKESLISGKDAVVKEISPEKILIGFSVTETKEYITEENQNLDVLTGTSKADVLQEDDLNIVQVTDDHTKLIQHIDEYVSNDLTEVLKDVSDLVKNEEILESISVATELREFVAKMNQLTGEKEGKVLEEAVPEKAKLTIKLQEALSTVQTHIYDNALKLYGSMNPENVEQLASVIKNLQEYLKVTVATSMPEEIKIALIEPSREESMKQLEVLLQEVSEKINVTSPDKTTDDTEELRDRLDEVQTVIIKLKRDSDRTANDTLNETLDDLECSVRSVQLQINEDSPHELLQEACATLLLLANDITESHDVNVETTIKMDESTNALKNCANDTEETVKLLDKAAKIENKDDTRLNNIIYVLSSLRDTMKILKSIFQESSEILIEKGIDVVQHLDNIEERLFSLERDVESEQSLDGVTKDTILTAVHSVYGSISNMRSTLTSIQKQFLYENYGKPCEHFLRSIKNISKILTVDKTEKSKTDWKTLSKSLRNVLNHFEDIKFYVNLDKTARIPGDATFTRVVLEELKFNINELLQPRLHDFGPDISRIIQNTMKNVENTLTSIETKSTIEVKEKIPIFKKIAVNLICTTNAILNSLEENANKLRSKEAPEDIEETSVKLSEQKSKEDSSKKNEVEILIPDRAIVEAEKNKLTQGEEIKALKDESTTDTPIIVVDNKPVLKESEIMPDQMHITEIKPKMEEEPDSEKHQIKSPGEDIEAIKKDKSQIAQLEITEKSKILSQKLKKEELGLKEIEEDIFLKPGTSQTIESIENEEKLQNTSVEKTNTTEQHKEDSLFKETKVTDQEAENLSIKDEKSEELSREADDISDDKVETKKVEMDQPMEQVVGTEKLRENIECNLKLKKEVTEVDKGKETNVDTKSTKVNEEKLFSDLQLKVEEETEVTSEKEKRFSKAAEDNMKVEEDVKIMSENMDENIEEKDSESESRRLGEKSPKDTEKKAKIEVKKLTEEEKADVKAKKDVKVEAQKKTEDRMVADDANNKAVEKANNEDEEKNVLENKEYEAKKVVEEKAKEEDESKTEKEDEITTKVAVKDNAENENMTAETAKAEDVKVPASQELDVTDAIPKRVIVEQNKNKLIQGNEIKASIEKSKDDAESSRFATSYDTSIAQGDGKPLQKESEIMPDQTMHITKIISEIEEEPDSDKLQIKSSGEDIKAIEKDNDKSQTAQLEFTEKSKILSQKLKKEELGLKEIEEDIILKPGTSQTIETIEDKDQFPNIPVVKSKTAEQHKEESLFKEVKVTDQEERDLFIKETENLSIKDEKSEKLSREADDISERKVETKNVEMDQQVVEIEKLKENIEYDSKLNKEVTEVDTMKETNVDIMSTKVNEEKISSGLQLKAKQETEVMSEKEKSLINKAEENTENEEEESSKKVINEAKEENAATDAVIEAQEIAKKEDKAKKEVEKKTKQGKESQAEKEEKEKAEKVTKHKAEEKIKQEAEVKKRKKEDEKEEKKAEEEQLKLEAELRAEAKESTERELEEQAKEEADEESKKKPEVEKVKLEAENKTKFEENTKQEAEAQAKKKVEEKAQIKAEEQEKAKLEAEEKGNIEKTKPDAEAQIKKVAEEEAKKKAEEEKAKFEAEETAKIEEKAKQAVEALAKITAEEELKKKTEDEKVKLETENKAKAEEKAKLKAEVQAKNEAEEKAKKEAEEEKVKLKAEKKAKAEEKAKLEADVQAKKEAEEKAKIEAEEEKVKLEAEKKAKAEEKAKKEAEVQAKKEAEEKAKIEAEEEKVKLEAEKKAKAEEKAKKEAEAQVKKEAEKDAKKKTEDEKVKLETENKAKAEEKAKLKAEVQAKNEAEEKAKKEAEEEKVKLEAEKKAKAEEKAKLEADVQAKKEAEEKAKIEAEEEKVKLEAEKKAKAEEKAKKEAEVQTKKEAEEKAKIEAEEEKVKLEAEKKAKAEEKAKKEAEVQTKKEAEEKAKIEAEEKKAKLVAENKSKAEEKAKLEADVQAKKEAEEEAKKKAEEEKGKLKADIKAKAEEKTKLEAEVQAKKDGEEEAKKKAEEEKAKLEAENKAKAEEKAKQEADAQGKKEAEEEAKKKAEAEKAKLEAENKAKAELEKEVQAKKEAEEKAKREAEEEKAKLEAEKKAKAEEKAKQEVEAQFKKEAEEEAKKKAEAEKAKLEAENKAKTELEAEVQAKKEAEEKAKREAEEEKAKFEAEKKAKAEEKAKQEVEVQAKKEAEEEAKKKAEEKNAELEAENKSKAEEKAKLEADVQAKKEAEEEAKKKAEEEKGKLKADIKAKAEEKTKLEAEVQAKKDGEEEAKKKAEEEKVKLEAENKAKAEEKAKLEAEVQTKKEAEEKAKKEAEEEKVKLETGKEAKTEEKTKQKAEAQHKKEAEEKTKKKEEENKVKLEAEKKAKAEEKTKQEAEVQAKKEAEEEAKKKAEEEKAKLEADIKAKAEEEAKKKAEAKAEEERVKLEADKRAKAEEKTKLEVEAQTRKEAEEKVKKKAEAKAKKVEKEAEEKAKLYPEGKDYDKKDIEEKAINEFEKIVKDVKEEEQVKLEAVFKTKKDIKESDEIVVQKSAEKKDEQQRNINEYKRTEDQESDLRCVTSHGADISRQYKNYEVLTGKSETRKYDIPVQESDLMPRVSSSRVDITTDKYTFQRQKHEEKERHRFIDHNHKDYTMDFARPTRYRERSFDESNALHSERLGKNAVIYKAQTIVLDSQLRSSLPPIPDVTKLNERDTERRTESRHRSKGLSEARSIISEKRSSVPRDIKRKPVFSTYLTDRTAVEGSRVKLTCSVLSSADPIITWYKNGVPLDNKLKYRTKFVDGLITLEVLNAVPSDSAEYSCTVENENGSMSCSANLKVYPSFEASPIPPTFTRSIRDNYHLAENELVLECRIRGQPLPTITWLKDDRPIIMNEKYQAYYLADGVCRLAINSPSPDDSGKYTCKAENSVWSDQITHVVNFTGKESRLSPNLATLERSRFSRHAMEFRRPHFTNVLTDYKVPRGGTIGLQVEINGSPTKVEWLREGRSVTEIYGNARTFVEQDLYTLALTDVTEKESGLYTCRAWSSHGTVDMNAAITVVQPNELEGKPAIIVGRPEKDILISVGEDVNISFRVQGEPKPKVIFMKGIRDITNSHRVCKMTSDDYVKFTLKRSMVSDAGTYCIFARNAYGCDRAFVTVEVRQRASSDHLISDWTYPAEASTGVADRKYKAVPERIPGEPSVVDGGNNWVSIAWPKPGPTTSAPVLAYKVESWLLGKEGGARWTELGITPLTSFDVFNLKQGEEYHFRITPRNRYGWGESVQTATPIAVGLAGDSPEFVDILPGQLKVLLGETAKLSCSVKGKPTPEVVWMRNGHEIEEEGRRVTTSFNGYNCCLTIKDITIEDEARYSCEATNPHGRASTYARLAVVTDRLIWEADAKLKRERSADVDGEYPPQFTMRLRDRRVQATYPVRLTCQVVGNPPPAITWFKDGEEVIADSRHIKSQDEHFHTLEIAPTTLEDGGMYEALARNTSGAVSCRCSLVVDKGIRAYVAPEFCCGLEPLYRVLEGEDLRISCVVEAYPSVGVVWYRDGVRLRTSRRAVMTIDRDGQIELALVSLSPRDAGVYTCTASNEVGRASTSGKVEVIEGDIVEKKKTPPALISPDVPYSKEPMFIRKPRSSEAREGDTVIIECEVIGDPKPDVYWLRDFLKPDYYRDATHFKRVGAGPEYRFEIPHAKLDYTGAYSVVARNVHGEAKAIISLQILARDPSSTEDHNIRYGRVEVLPRFERNLTDLLCYDGDAIEFECRVSGNPEPDIRWFHYNEIIRECPDFESTFEEGTARLKIKQVTAEDEGPYTCEATNSLGKAVSNACLVVYPPGEPNTLSQRLRRPPALLSAASTPRSTPRTTPARSMSRTRTPGPDTRRLCSPSRLMAPKFYTYPFNKVVEEGDHVTFQCAVKGHPPPWTTWDKDGVIVTPSARITMKEKDDMLRILEIEHVTIEDVGLYRITVENECGRVEASARLEVITQKGKFYAGVRAYSPSPRRSQAFRRRPPSLPRQD